MKKFLRLVSITVIFGFCFHIGAAQIVSPLSDTTICLGESVVLEAAAGSYMYNWSTGDLSRSISVSPSITTSYNLRVFIPDISTELIANGDFNAGNTGFYSEYVYCPDPILSSSNHSDPQSLWEEGRYAVDDNPNAYHANFSSCSGHSGGSPDKMLIVNGASEEDVVVWSETITVNPNQYYAFSTWACNVHPTNPARLEFMIDGVLMGDYIEPSAGTTCLWEEFYSLWYSGANTSIEISIVNKNTIRSGNDYALDGISFNPLNEVPDTRTINVIDPAIVNVGSDIEICGNEIANLSATTSNNTDFYWTTSGDGVFSNPTSTNSNYTPGNNDILNGSVILSANANSNTPCRIVSDSLTLILKSIPAVDFGSQQASCDGGDVILDAENPGSTYIWNTGEMSQSIAVSSAGNYSVTITGANSCVNADTVFVGFYANFTIDLGPDRTVCSGEPVVLNAGISGATYLWNTGETTQEIIVYNAGNYSVDVTNKHGCNATDDVNVTLLPPPVVDLGPDQVLNSGDVIRLDAGVHFAYIWDNGYRGRYLNVNKPGLYAVRVYDANGCSSMDMINITSATGIIPNVTLNDTITCRDESVELYAGNDFLFNWDVAGLSSRVVVTPDSTTTYHLRLFYIDQTLELVNNGDFTLGNIGFQSGYYYCSNPWSWSCRHQKSKYIINSNTTILGGGFSDCTGITGNFPDNVMVVKGAEAHHTVWEQTINVDTDSYYMFSVNITNLHSNSYDEFEIKVNGVIVDQFYTDEPCNWDLFKSLIYSNSNTQLTITIDNISTSGVGNGYALDGISMFKLSEIPLDVTVDVVQHPTVNAGSDLSICEGGVADLTGNASNYSSVMWRTLGDGSLSDVNLLNTNYNPGTNDAINGFVDIELTANPLNPCVVPVKDTVRVNINKSLIVDLGSDKEICQSVSVLLDAGHPGAAYLWSTGETTQTVNVSTTGNYQVTVIDATGCSGTDSVNVTVHANPIVDLGIDQETCNGNTIMLDAGNPGKSFIWNTGDAIQAILVSTSGNYSVVVTNTNGCSASDDVNVTVHANPIVDLGADQQTCAGSSIVLDAGNAGATYLWSTGETTQTISTSISGNYSVVVTNTNGCSASDDMNVTVHANSIVDLGADQQTCAGSSITLDAGNAGATYLWSTGETSQTINVSTSGNYSVTVTNGNGCSASDDMNLSVHPNPVVNLGADQTVCGGTKTTIRANNVYNSYLWNTGETSRQIEVNTSNRYSVLVSDKNGCTAVDSIDVVFYKDFNFALAYTTNLVCHGDSTYIQGPNNPLYTYQWKHNGVNIPNTNISSLKVGKSGWYSLEIYNENGCFDSDSVEVEIITLPNSPLPDRVDMCYGESVKLDIGEGEKFLWNDSISTQIRDVNKSGIYSVMVQDINGCIAYDSVEVKVHDLPIVDLGPDLYICRGEELILEAPDGYYTEWNPGGNTRSIYVYEAGTFQLKTTDEFGCTGEDDINIFVHENPEVNLGRDTVIAEGSELLLDAGNGYVEYEWSNQASSQFLKVDQDGEYAVNVVDMYGCRGNGKVKVAVNPIPTINLGGSAGICEGTSLLLDAGNWDKYLWSTGSTNRTISVNKSGDYTVQVWDMYGIMGSDIIHVEVYPTPQIGIAADTLSIYKGQSVTIDAGSGYSSYNWSNGSDWRSIDVNEAGDYSVQVMNKFGCIAKANVTVKYLKPKMVVPNVFTPNGKGPNEIFYPVFKGVVTNFEMYIYSRWGEQVFELKKDMVSNNELKYEGWNGTYKGKESEIGVYVWIIFYGGKEQAHGTVTLFR
ncbi:gliding motility-associated C-terminal domain-containing protein [Ancylomarina longa]|uniref:Gliding motility-associated C-terminal domain-containing protein n=1 Tax=Ancylomarina longa TaxID=2487017 RepID=A0A434AUZ5_9BACT|nr:gliding motility-associated C-terminal domain-containing protein [Ancylomarina longa]RUT78263.1 gliding motility-associated C-terminal domain-containing protein [Ancylomarina longa]